MYQMAHLHNAILLRKNASILQPLASLFTIDRSFKMTYCMNFYLNWRRNYTWSNLEACFLLSKYQSSSYDHVQFLCQLRQKFIQQLILKLLSIVKRDAKGQRMLAFLRSKTALCKWAIQYIKPALSEQKFSALYILDHQASILNILEVIKKLTNIIVQNLFIYLQMLTFDHPLVL